MYTMHILYNAHIAVLHTLIMTLSLMCNFKLRITLVAKKRMYDCTVVGISGVVGISRALFYYNLVILRFP